MSFHGNWCDRDSLYEAAHGSCLDNCLGWSSGRVKSGVFAVYEQKAHSDFQMERWANNRCTTKHDAIYKNKNTNQLVKIQWWWREIVDKNPTLCSKMISNYAHDYKGPMTKESENKKLEKISIRRKMKCVKKWFNDENYTKSIVLTPCSC